MQAADGTSARAATIERGQYFGEIELLRGGALLAEIRAAESGVEVIALDRQTFTTLLAASPATREAIARVAEARVAENIAARQREGAA